ncbi:MAG: efflux RND transporter periplasmic adaptor subunit [Chitinivibrionales bacterium]|nr:efflux RND transporter periplasmic adaptor subunit [Chitinivibrionales bacterium]MBD3396770.1 efflux RND transporter periplasmic adaptor subunit [Chitinivibrionales bacterium]
MMIGGGLVKRGVPAVFAAALLGLSAGCGEKQEPGKSIAEIQKEEGVPVRVMTVEPGPLRSVERAGGTIEGGSQAVLSGGVPGTLIGMYARVGRKVKKGALLAQIEPDYGSSFDAAKAAYESAEKSRERVAALAKEGGVSQEVVEQVEVAAKGAKLNLEKAKKSERIYAPFPGTIIEVMQTKNSKVGPGQALVKIANLNNVRVTLDINESLIDRFAVEQRAFVVAGDDTLYGTVEKVPIGADEAGHMFPIDVVFPNTTSALKPGMFVTVYVITVDLPDALSVPAEVVLHDEEGPYVYVVDGDAARKARLELGVHGDGRVRVAGGLQEGAKVVVQGASQLGDGTNVNVVQ